MNKIVALNQKEILTVAGGFWLINCICKVFGCGRKKKKTDSDTPVMVHPASEFPLNPEVNTTLTHRPVAPPLNIPVTCFPCGATSTPSST